ncbi:MAG: hypothetical protein ABF876_00495 [Acetobacter aceti]|uniref:hypothetical protein n=1 Tax=Acetobacter aceti TaxID=435 RepID=UPI001656BB06|nr:hypothetical protein [Acetobacter aceti]
MKQIEQCRNFLHRIFVYVAVDSARHQQNTIESPCDGFGAFQIREAAIGTQSSYGQQLE